LTGPGTVTASADTSALTLKGVSKVFQGQRALDDVSLELRRGEVHCLLGQNGSGKSTLIKILAGYHSPDGNASATVSGEPLQLGSAAAANAAGIQFIHQDLALIDQIPVFENLALGQSFAGRFWLSERREQRRAKEIFAHYGIDIDTSRPLNTLGAAQRTMTAIVRALHHGKAAQGILVLDEPTASLSQTDTDHLFALLQDVKARGGTVLYVTHRLEEVFEIADRVSVLRDGRKIATRDVAELDHAQLVTLILGRSLEALYPELPTPGTDAVLEVEHLSGGALAELSVTVHAGEIVGVVGLTGSGVDDVPHLIFGAAERRQGTIKVAGEVVDPRSPWEAIRARLAFVPGDRKRLGGVGPWTLRENVTLPKVQGSGPLDWLSARREAREVLPYLERFDVRPLAPEARLSSLSGGNQQKIMIARWMRLGAAVFLLEEPTAGVDVGAKSAIYKALTGVAEQGAGILLTTSDFEEACAICDRVIVLRDGRVGATLFGAQSSVDHILGAALKQTDRAVDHQVQETADHA
jgi:ribose transport system ATP-binding protein